MPNQSLRRSLCAGLVVGLVALTTNAPILAGSGAELTGRVLDVDGTTPRSGVVVTLYDQAAEAAVSSDPTDARGGFRIDAAPAGQYRVLVETDAGAFLAADAIELREGTNRPLALNLQPPAVGEEAPSSTPAGQAGGLRTWAKWAIVGGMAIGAVVVIDGVSGEDDASGF